MTLPGAAVEALHTQHNSPCPRMEHPKMDESNEGKTGSYNDWPNNIGFDIHSEQREPVELTVTGHIPEYCRGTLYRVGPGGNTIQPNDPSLPPISISHWFDGLGQIHRFQIVSPTQIIYSSRFTCDTLVERIRQTGQFHNNFTFGQKRDPCQSYFRKFVSMFSSRVDLTTLDASDANVNVTVSYNIPGLSSHGQGPNLVAKTDANVMQILDPETLEPRGVVNQSVLHPSLTGPLSAAHCRVCPKTGDVFNYNLTLGPITTYQIFRISASTEKTDILATIKDAPASYIHSFFLTETHVVLCCFSARYKYLGLKLLYVKNILESLSSFSATDPRDDAVWYLIPRTPSPTSPIARLTSPAFFSFHCTNAYNLPSSDIIAECITYRTLDILSKFYLAHLRGDSPAAIDWVDKGRGVLTRFLLSPSRGTVERVYEAPAELAVELPTLNPRFVARRHRYTYALVSRGRSTLLDGIVKFDAEAEGGEGEGVKVWECHGHTPGEAVFVGDPEGTEEDDGVLLSVVLDGMKGVSYLLCLDARTMVEVGRAEVGGVVGLGFHGNFVKDG
ncbi:carotenoid oxygenase, partial [Ascodesmis nigricans]